MCVCLCVWREIESGGMFLTALWCGCGMWGTLHVFDVMRRTQARRGCGPSGAPGGRARRRAEVGRRSAGAVATGVSGHALGTRRKGGAAAPVRLRAVWCGVAGLRACECWLCASVEAHCVVWCHGCDGVCKRWSDDLRLGVFFCFVFSPSGLRWCFVVMFSGCSDV